MAAKNQPRLKLDDFVGAVRGDPSASDPLLFTSGYVGRSPMEGNIRIYSDPSLSRWIEAAEEDVVHSMPIADSPLGGSHLWLRGSAQLSPGIAGGPTGEPVPGLPGEPIPKLPDTWQACLETRFPLCIQQEVPVTRQLICPTLPPMCIQQEPPVTRQLVCPTLPPMCIQQEPPVTRQLACPTLPPMCIQQDPPVTRQLACPTLPPMCIQQEPPMTRQIVCPTLPPVCFQQQPIGSLACAGFAARAEPTFTDPTVCTVETGHIPCENFPPRAARVWYTMHFCAFAQPAQPLAGTYWATCACPSPSAGPWNC